MSRLSFVLIVVAACGGPASTDFGADEPDDTDTVATDSEPTTDVDVDADGFIALVDCNDADALVHPGAPERCNGVDDDCDGANDKDVVPLASPAFVGPLYLDRDADGWGDEHTETWFCLDPGAGWLAQAGDCDDADPTLRPDSEPACPAATPTCGDRTVGPGERCDDGNTASGDGCSATCAWEYCGDGTAQAKLGEGCDDGGHASGDGCSLACADEVCGDGVVQLALGETCDDGALADGDGCSADCLSETCGDGSVQAQGGEACDDGGTTPGDDCSPTCRLEGCGDGVVDGDERCDDGNRVDGDGCTAACHLERFRITPVGAELEPLEEISGETWDLLLGDELPDGVVLAKVGGVLQFRTATVRETLTPAWHAVYVVQVPAGETLDLTLGDFDSQTDADVVGTWALDADTLEANVGRTITLTSSMVTSFQLRVDAPF